MVKKIAIINQRYGLEVNGGSEFYTRQIAEKLSGIYDVEVITTTAVDYITWENYYPKGIQEINGVTVRRFLVDKKRNLRKFNYLNRAMHLLNLKINRLEQWWLNEQGPVSTECIEYIRDNADKYDVFIFVTYLYYLTAKGMPFVAEKSILIPTAHDEPCIYFGIYRKIFSIPKVIIYLTDEEKKFVQKLMKNDHIASGVIGIGVNYPKEISGERFCEKFGIDSPYIIYVGRIDEGKGCRTLFDYYMKYNNNSQIPLKLVLLGKKEMDIPDDPDIIELGFVKESDKFDGIIGSNALILPSNYESLSISVLEAMSIGVPVLVNGNCEVLKAHCMKSKGGLYYTDYKEFEIGLDTIIDKNEEYEAMAAYGKKYVESNYQWDVVLEQFKNMIAKI